MLGDTVPEDDAEAVTWDRNAAEKVHALAQTGLGDAYNVGSGVPQDLVLAHKSYILAASRLPLCGAQRTSQVTSP